MLMILMAGYLLTIEPLLYPHLTPSAFHLLFCPLLLLPDIPQLHFLCLPMSSPLSFLMEGFLFCLFTVLSLFSSFVFITSQLPIPSLPPFCSFYPLLCWLLANIKVFPHPFLSLSPVSLIFMKLAGQPCSASLSRLRESRRPTASN